MKQGVTSARLNRFAYCAFARNRADFLSTPRNWEAVRVWDGACNLGPLGSRLLRSSGEWTDMHSISAFAATVSECPPSADFLDIRRACHISQAAKPASLQHTNQHLSLLHWSGKAWYKSQDSDKSAMLQPGAPPARTGIAGSKC